MQRFSAFWASVVLLASPAFAGVAWDWNFSSLTGGAIPSVTNIDQAQIIAGRVRGFRDAPGPGQGVISSGDTFDDFIAIRFTTMTSTRAII